MNYLIENKECERSFLRRLWGFWNNLDPILIALGFNPHCSWALIEVEMSGLGASLKGDVDILIGQIAWNDPKQFAAALTEEIEGRRTAHPDALIHLVNPANRAAEMVACNGGIQWPPPTKYLVGIEAKCSRLDIKVDPYKANVDEDDMKSTKSSRGRVNNFV